MNITEFLLARITEDELRANYYGPLAMGTARVLAECAAKRAIIAEHEWRTVAGETGCGLCNYSRDYGWEDTGPCATIRALAAIYADHKDYDPAWSPDAH